MRKKYIRPSVELVRHISETPILAGSPGSGSSGVGREREREVDRGDGDTPGETAAKYNQFSSWENWDEY